MVLFESGQPVWPTTIGLTDGVGASEELIGIRGVTDRIGASEELIEIMGATDGVETSAEAIEIVGICDLIAGWIESVLEGTEGVIGGPIVAIVLRKAVEDAGDTVMRAGLEDGNHRSACKIRSSESYFEEDFELLFKT